MDNDIAISVNDLHKTFRLPHEQHSGIKQYILNVFRRRRVKGYEDQHVLKGINFEIKKGEFFGIVGRNGSGKSTLLKLLAGIYVPDKGHINVNGTLVPFIELGVGFNPELTGRENVYLNGALLGFNHKYMEAIYDEIVEFAELKKFMDQKLKNYSSGMQVRLAFSIAIRAETDILVLDEVLAVGDAAFQLKCYEYFDSLRSGGKTVVLVTHDMSAVQRFCSRALLINKGKIEAIGDPFEIADQYKELNIPGGTIKDKDSNKESKIHELTATIVQQDKEKVVVDFDYSSKENIEMYVGISVIHNGISVAELTTSLSKPLTKKGMLTLTIPKNIFNEGVYSITAAMFKKENRELIAVDNTRNIMRVEGFDITKGGVMKLDDTWEYK